MDHVNPIIQTGKEFADVLCVDLDAVINYNYILTAGRLFDTLYPYRLVADPVSFSALDQPCMIIDDDDEIDDYEIDEEESSQERMEVRLILIPPPRSFRSPLRSYDCHLSVLIVSLDSGLLTGCKGLVRPLPLGRSCDQNMYYCLAVKEILELKLSPSSSPCVQSECIETPTERRTHRILHQYPLTLSVTGPMRLQSLWQYQRQPAP